MMGNNQQKQTSANTKYAQQSSEESLKVDSVPGDVS